MQGFPNTGTSGTSPTLPPRILLNTIWGTLSLQQLPSLKRYCKWQRNWGEIKWLTWGLVDIYFIRQKAVTLLCGLWLPIHRILIFLPRHLSAFPQRLPCFTKQKFLYILYIHKCIGMFALNQEFLKWPLSENVFSLAPIPPSQPVSCFNL